MTTTVIPLLDGQAATQDGQSASADLIEVIQRLAEAVEELQALQSGIAAVSAPSGGATQDAEARTAIAAIISAAT